MNDADHGFLDDVEGEVFVGGDEGAGPNKKCREPFGVKGFELGFARKCHSLLPFRRSKVNSIEHLRFDVMPDCEIISVRQMTHSRELVAISRRSQSVLQSRRSRHSALVHDPPLVQALQDRR